MRPSSVVDSDLLLSVVPVLDSAVTVLALWWEEHLFSSN